MGQDFEVFVSVGPMFCQRDSVEYVEFEISVIAMEIKERQNKIN